ncbi:MAG: hypothetical protein HY096_13460 [Nitrospinae bacterium]|nr:hypothetical protein [Nitrospinota bacterium]
MNESQKTEDRRQKTEKNFFFLTSCILLIASCFLYLFSCKTPLKSEVKSPQFKILSVIYQKELQYIKARVSNELDKLYSFQHPEYKTIISMDKFTSSGGSIQLDYSSITEQNPNPLVYIPPRQFHFILHDIKIEKAFIDKDGRYAKFHTIHIMSIFLPIAKGVPVKREMKSIDYWEKVNGEWFF